MVKQAGLSVIKDGGEKNNLCSSNIKIIKITKIIKIEV